MRSHSSTEQEKYAKTKDIRNGEGRRNVSNETKIF
jgi:hypothetical protein